MILETHDKSIPENIGIKVNSDNHPNYSDETDRIDEVNLIEPIEQINPEDANPDPITVQTGANPLGTCVGAAGVGSVATFVGAAVAGPVGAVVGAVVGSVAGGLVGKGTAESLNPSSEDNQSFKDA
jgi:hypothetical protein